ncbi:MAG: RES family NAD+ phosphorylase [Daejeonella sp.]
MIVYRLSKAAYYNDLSGKGAELSGGRWNTKGRAIIYTSESRALCTAEIAVHTPLGIVPKDYYLSLIEISNDIAIEEISQDKLPLDWKSFPHSETTQLIGDQFLKEQKNLLLKVPSAVVQGEFNYLINPNHPDIFTIKVIRNEQFQFDERLFLRH